MLKCRQPMGTVFVTDRENCRKCGKCLILEKKCHLVVVYHTMRGTYLGSRLAKECYSCKIHEHYGNWTMDGKKIL